MGRTRPLALTAALALASAATAATSNDPKTVSGPLGEAAAVRLDTVTAGARRLHALAGVGDVNGDRRPDAAFLIEQRSEPGGDAPVRAAELVLNEPGVRRVRLGERSSGVVRLEAPEDGVIAAVDGAGDVNGDGVGDVVVGVTTVEPADQSSAFLVFGSQDLRSRRLGEAGAAEVRIASEADMTIETSVAGLGDVNGDGRSDIALAGTPRTAGQGSRPARAFVVYGQSSPGEVRLAGADYPGFEIEPPDADTRRAYVARVGDVSGDGLSDVGVAFDGGRPVIDIVFGGGSERRIALGSSPAAGVRVEPGSERFDGAGDVNGDGRADIVVGRPNGFAPGTCEGCGPDYNPPGAAFVVLGGAAGSVNLQSPGSRGFRMDGPNDAAEDIGVSVAGVGDANADGFDDVLVAGSGRALAYLVRGARGLGTVDLARSSGRVAQFVWGEKGPAPGAAAVSDVGDWTRDGLPDMLINLTRGHPNDAAYVLSGFRFGTCRNELAGRSGRDALRGSISGDRLVGRSANDTLEGLSGADCLDGGRGKDVLRGGAGHDRLRGGRGSDRLFGGDGHDVLVDRAGRSAVFAGNGRDRIDTRNSRRDVVDCGPGADVARVDQIDRPRRCERVRRS